MNWKMFQCWPKTLEKLKRGMLQWIKSQHSSISSLTTPGLISLLLDVHGTLARFVPSFWRCFILFGETATMSNAFLCYHRVSFLFGALFCFRVRTGKQGSAIISLGSFSFADTIKVNGTALSFRAKSGSHCTRFSTSSVREEEQIYLNTPGSWARITDQGELETPTKQQFYGLWLPSISNTRYLSQHSSAFLKRDLLRPEISLGVLSSWSERRWVLFTSPWSLWRACFLVFDHRVWRNRPVVFELGLSLFALSRHTAPSS